jgi:hypothetical protein
MRWEVSTWCVVIYIEPSLLWGRVLYMESFYIVDRFHRSELHGGRCVAFCKANTRILLMNLHAWKPITFGVKGSSYFCSQITGSVENSVPLYIDISRTSGRSSDLPFLLFIYYSTLSRQWLSTKKMSILLAHLSQNKYYIHRKLMKMMTTVYYYYVLFLINVFKNKIDCCYIMDTVGLRVPTKKIRDLFTLTSVKSQTLSFQQGASRLQTTSGNL